MNKLSAAVIATGILLSGSAFATYKVVNSVQNSTFNGTAPIPTAPLSYQAASAQISDVLVSQPATKYGTLSITGDSSTYDCYYYNLNGTTPVPTDGKAVYVQKYPNCNYGFNLCCSVKSGMY